MYRSLSRSNVGSRNRSQPGQFRSFAQPAFGIAIRAATTSESRQEAELRTLERLAQFSSRLAEELRQRRFSEAETLRESHIEEWCAAISTDGEASLKRVLSRRSEFPAGGQRVNSFTARNLLESDWNPADHPRVPKGEPGGGQWMDKDGGSGVGGSRTKGLTVKRAIYSRAKKPHVLPVGDSPGHHWVNLASAFDPDVRPYLTDEAAQYAAGITSGALDPPHNSRPMNGVKHKDYNKIVKKELQKYIKLKKLSLETKMTDAQMKEFADFVANGRGANGKRHPKLEGFNSGIKATVKPGVKLPTTMDEVKKIGIQQMKKRGFQMVAAGAVISNMAGQVVADEVGFLNVAAKSHHYKDAINALHKGDLDQAQRLMVGDNDSFFHDLVGNVSHLAALNFKRKMEKIFSEARNRKYE